MEMASTVFDGVSAENPPFDCICVCTVLNYWKREGGREGEGGRGREREGRNQGWREGDRIRCMTPNIVDTTRHDMTRHDTYADSLPHIAGANVPCVLKIRRLTNHGTIDFRSLSLLLLGA